MTKYEGTTWMKIFKAADEKTVSSVAALNGPQSRTKNNKASTNGQPKKKKKNIQKCLRRLIWSPQENIHKCMFI